MKNNILLYVMFGLFLVSQTFNTYENRKLHNYIDDFNQRRKKEIELKETRAQVKIDSLSKVIEAQEYQISLVVQSLNKSIQQSKINNQRHESIKNNIPNLTADSIAKRWSKRYER